MRQIFLIGNTIGIPTALDHTWLREYDPDAHGGRGVIRGTKNRAEAMQFAEAGDAMKLWRAQSRVRPLRPDGRPNRPLTAYTIEVCEDGHDPLLPP